MLSRAAYQMLTGAAVSLLTTIIRGDRFSEGELAGAYESGMLRAIVRRAAELAGAP